MDLNEFNMLKEDDAVSILLACCHCENWAKSVVSQRPFASKSALFNAASSIWQNLTSQDYLEAFSAHPQIGDLSALRDKFSSANKEQGQVAHAKEQVLEALHESNREYLEKFGFIFIVFATGKSADEMLGILKSRMNNSRDQEIFNAATEQQKITELRLSKMLEENIPMNKASITTHILDLDRGNPASDMRVQLISPTSNEIAATATSDNDGRIVLWDNDVELVEGTWKLIFITGEWFEQQDKKTFYPEVELSFIVTDVSEHYHVPLLLSAFGYSTYRGS